MRAMIRSRQFWLGLGIFVLGLLLNQVSATYIKHKHGEGLPVLADFFLDIMPYWNICWSYDVALILAIAGFLYYALRHDSQGIPYFLAIFGLSQMLRGISIALTPFGNPYPGPFTCIFYLDSMFYGVFPSGHIAIVFTCFLLARRKGFKNLFLALTAIITATMLLARGHYSVDIFAAFIYSYALYVFGERNLKKIFKR